MGTTLNIPLPPGTSDEGYLYTVENVVLPILEAFKPDIVINSAGQDNHYSDPLTNMNFSAQGYAKLTTLLSPDIAVLEGGYSIEGALPYVNLGIILALAGMDYGNVREPDYRPESIRQNQRTTDMIKKVGETVLTYWEHRETVQKKMQSRGEFIDRSRNIFYDTDGIREMQQETTRVCKECGGALRIDSASDTGQHMLGIHVPFTACDACRKQGRKWFDEADPAAYDFVALQDRPEDEYRIKGA